MNKSSLKPIARRIRHYRALRQLTQHELSKAAGINYRHLQRIESGKISIQSVTLRKIASALKIPSLLLSDWLPHQCHSSDDERCCLESAVLNKLPAGVSVVDTTGLLLYTNMAHAKLCGRSSKLVDGKLYCWDFAESEAKKQLLKRFFFDNLRLRPAPTPLQSRNFFPDGSFLDVVVNWEYLTDFDGQISAILCVVFPAGPPK